MMDRVKLTALDRDVKLVSQEPIKVPHTYSISPLREAVKLGEVPRGFKSSFEYLKRWWQVRKLTKAWEAIYPHVTQYYHPVADREVPSFTAIDFSHSQLLEEIARHATLVRRITDERPDTIIVGRDIMDKLYKQPNFMGHHLVQTTPQWGSLVHQSHTGQGTVETKSYTLLGMRVIFLPYVEGLVVFRSKEDSYADSTEAHMRPWER